VPKDEFLCGVLAQLARCMLTVCLVQGIEVSGVQGNHDRVTEILKDLAEVERELATGLKEIIGQPTQVAGLGAQYDDEARVLAARSQIERNFVS